MEHYVLIACVAKKKSFPSLAHDLYQSALFRKAYKYAQSLKPNGILILSAKHGLVKSDDWLEPYDETLNGQPTKIVEDWAEVVVNQLKEFANLDEDHFTVLAGQKYRRFLVPHLQHFTIPLEGLSIGKQLQKLDHLVR